MVSGFVYRFCRCLLKVLWVVAWLRLYDMACFALYPYGTVTE